MEPPFQWAGRCWPAAVEPRSEMPCRTAKDRTRCTASATTRTVRAGAEVFDLPYRDKPVPTSELRLYRRQITRYRTHRITTFRTSHPTESSSAQPSKCPVVPRSLTKSSSSLSELARQAPVLLSVPLLVPRVSSLWISARSVLPLPISPTWQVERRKSVSQSNICARHAADV